MRKAKQARTVCGDTGPVHDMTSADLISYSNNLMFSQNILTISRDELSRLPKIHRIFAEQVLIKENKLRVV